MARGRSQTVLAVPSEWRSDDAFNEHVLHSRRSSRGPCWPPAPAARYAHPRAGHLRPLMVAAGAAAGEPGRRIFADQVMGVAVSAIGFGAEPGTGEGGRW